MGGGIRCSAARYRRNDRRWFRVTLVAVISSHGSAEPDTDRILPLVPPHLQEHHGGEVIGVLHRAQLSGAVRVHPGHVTVVQGGERIGIPGREKGEQLLVGRSPDHIAHTL